jgi:hypothetical protein
VRVTIFDCPDRPQGGAREKARAFQICMSVHAPKPLKPPFWIQSFWLGILRLGTGVALAVTGWWEALHCLISNLPMDIHVTRTELRQAFKLLKNVDRQVTVFNPPPNPTTISPKTFSKPPPSTPLSTSLSPPSLALSPPRPSLPSQP